MTLNDFIALVIVLFGLPALGVAALILVAFNAHKLED